MGSTAQPLPDQAGQPGLHSPHQPQQLQGIDQQPYMLPGPAQGQAEPAPAQSQQFMHHMQQPVGPTYQPQSQSQVQQLPNQSEVPVSSHGLSLDHLKQPSEAASMSVGLSTAPQSANSLGVAKMTSLERLRIAAAAAISQQYSDQPMGVEPDVLSASLVSSLAYDLASQPQAGSQPSSQPTVQPHSFRLILTSDGLCGTELPSAPVEQQGLSDLGMPEGDCFGDDLSDILAWQHQTAGINFGGQDREVVEAGERRPASRRDSAASKRDKVKDTKLQVRKDACKFAETGRSRHKRALVRSLLVLQALQVQQQVP